MSEGTVPSLDEFVAARSEKPCRAWCCRTLAPEHRDAALGGLGKGYPITLVLGWLEQLGYGLVDEHVVRRMRDKHGGDV